MSPLFSPHAQELFQNILFEIQDELSYEDAIRWHDKIITSIAQLETFPLSCPVVPLECFREVPANPERLHLLTVRPYQIVYEIVEGECLVLSIRHRRMLMTTEDASWH